MYFTQQTNRVKWTEKHALTCDNVVEWLYPMLVIDRLANGRTKSEVNKFTGEWDYIDLSLSLSRWVRADYSGHYRAQRTKTLRETRTTIAPVNTYIYVDATPAAFRVSLLPRGVEGYNMVSLCGVGIHTAPDASDHLSRTCIAKGF